MGSLTIPKTLPEQIQEALKTRNHVLTLGSGRVGGAAMIFVDAETKQVTELGPFVGKVE